MKRLLTAISVVMCVVLMATGVFGAGSDALSTYQSAAKKMNDATAMQISGTFKSAVDITGVGDSSLIYDFKIKQRRDAQGKLEMSMSFEMRDIGINSYVYYKDGYLYTHANDEKTKVKMKESEAAFRMIASPAESWFSSSTVEAVSGGQSIQAKIPAKQLDKLLGGMLSSETGKLYSSYLMEMGKVKVSSTYTIDENGYLQSQKLTYSQSIESIKSKYTVNLKFSNFDNVDSIAFPADLASYKTK